MGVLRKKKPLFRAEASTTTVAFTLDFSFEGSRRTIEFLDGEHFVQQHKVGEWCASPVAQAPTPRQQTQQHNIEHPIGIERFVESKGKQSLLQVCNHQAQDKACKSTPVKCGDRQWTPPFRERAVLAGTTLPPGLRVYIPVLKLGQLSYQGALMMDKGAWNRSLTSSGRATSEGSPNHSPSASVNCAPWARLQMALAHNRCELG